nr:hypothetical protein [Tanacetum cinerariifolium]
MGKDTIQLENAVSTISQEYVLEFTSEYGMLESLHPELPGPKDPIVEFHEGTVGVYTKYFEFANFRIPISQFLFDILGHYQIHLSQLVFPTVADWRTSALKDQMPPVGSYSMADINSLNTRHMDLFGLISAPNPAKVKTRTRPHVTRKVPLLTTIANRVIYMEDMTGTSGSSGTPSTVEKSPLDFSNEDPPPLITEKYPQREITGFHGNRDGYHCLRTCDQEIPVHTKGVSDPDSLSYVKLRSAREKDVAQCSRKAVVTEDSDSEKSTSFTSMFGSLGSIYQPGWGVTNNSCLDTLVAYQDMVDHIVPPGLWFEQETKLLKKAVAQVARRDQRIKAREKHIQNLKALLEVEVDIKGAVEAKNVKLAKEMESLRAQLMGEERIKDAFKEFKKYEDDRIIGHGLRLAVMKLKYGVEHGKAKVDLAAIEAYDPEANTKYVAALHALKDLKYPLVDQLEKLKYAPIDVIMASLFLKSDYGEDAPQWICELRPSSSQLKILVYPEVHNSKDPWSFKDEILLEDAIASNVSYAKKKKKCQVVCRTHRVIFAHHAMSDGVLVLVPTVAPQGLAILLADAATQIEIIEDEASPRLIRSESLPPLYNLEWP